MRLTGIFARAIPAAFILIGALTLGQVLRGAREGVPSATDAAAALSASSSSPFATPAVCAALSAVTPALAPALATVDRGDGTKTVTSAEGGWEVRVPAAWLVSPGALGLAAAQFGQAHVSSYDPKTAPTPDPERWMLPPSVGITFDVQVWMDPDREPLDVYSRRVFIGPDEPTNDPGTFVRIDGRDAYRFTIEEQHRFQRGDGTLVVTRQTRAVWIVRSGRDDRVIVAYATPGESELLPLVEKAMAAMKITTPVASRRPVVHQRDEVLRQWLYDNKGTLISGRRAEAKLMTYDEAANALLAPPVMSGPSPAPRAYRLLRIDHDPDDLYWVVAVSGPGLPEGRHGPPGITAPGTSIATPPPTSWIVFETSATGDNTGGTGGQYATQGTWPPTFDALTDRCR